MKKNTESFEFELIDMKEKAVSVESCACCACCGCGISQELQQ